MYQKKLERDIRCPLEYGFEISGGKCICQNDNLAVIIILAYFNL